MASINISNVGEATLFAQQTEERQKRVRALAAAIVREYNQATTSDKADINAIVDELLGLTP